MICPPELAHELSALNGLGKGGMSRLGHEAEYRGRVEGGDEDTKGDFGRIRAHESRLTHPNFWRQVDATVGKCMARYRNLWNANDLSDGCFVEFSVTYGNV